MNAKEVLEKLVYIRNSSTDDKVRKYMRKAMLGVDERHQLVYLNHKKNTRAVLLRVKTGEILYHDAITTKENKDNTILKLEILYNKVYKIMNKKSLLDIFKK